MKLIHRLWRGLEVAHGGVTPQALAHPAPERGAVVAALFRPVAVRRLEDRQEILHSLIDYGELLDAATSTPGPACGRKTASSR
ncbi:MAG TPA: hypothetical protein VHV09_00865 [Trebonia sp.]|nr:hypothetical protein [Trebonia sp.]